MTTRPRGIARIALAATVMLLVGACGDDGGTQVDSEEYQRFREQPTACGADRPAPAQQMSFDSPDDLGLTDNVRATIVTSCGTVVVELVPAVAPATVNSFVFLADRGYFDGTAIHRILPGFVIQAGDPTASGMGGPGYRIEDELPPEGFDYGPGIVAMANAGPNTSGSQFFIVIGDSGLPATFSVFGAVVDGAETLGAIAAVPRGPSSTGEPSRPLETVYIESVTIER